MTAGNNPGCRFENTYSNDVSIWFKRCTEQIKTDSKVVISSLERFFALQS